MPYELWSELFEVPDLSQGKVRHVRNSPLTWPWSHSQGRYQLPTLESHQLQSQPRARPPSARCHARPDQLPNLVLAQNNSSSPRATQSSETSPQHLAPLLRCSHFHGCSDHIFIFHDSRPETVLSIGILCPQSLDCRSCQPRHQARRDHVPCERDAQGGCL